MARSLRSNAAQANKKKLREKTFRPHETARLERLSTKQKKIVDQPKPEKKSKDAGSNDVDMTEGQREDDVSAKRGWNKLTLCRRPKTQASRARVRNGARVRHWARYATISGSAQIDFTILIAGAEATPNTEAVPTGADVPANTTDAKGTYTPAAIAAVLSGGLVFLPEFQQPGPFTEAEEVFMCILGSRLMLGKDIAGFREDGCFLFNDPRDLETANFFGSDA